MLENFKVIQENIQQMTLKYGRDFLAAYEHSLEAAKNRDIAKLDEIKKMVKERQKSEHKIDKEIIKALALFAPQASDLRILVACMKITSEFTRMGDYIKAHIKNDKMHINDEFEWFHLQAHAEAFHQSTLKTLRYAVLSLETVNVEQVERTYRNVKVEESKCDDLYSLLEKEILEQICLTPDFASELVTYLDRLRKVERISDRSVNIVNLSLYAKRGGKI